MVLHRVGSDRAGPLDSMRSGANGQYRFRYRAFGASDALYFVSAQYRGIAYFSGPLRKRVADPGDADLLVYDTTSNGSSLRLQGRHLVVSAPRNGKRELAEIFEIENDGQRTVVARDSTNPVWATRVPPRAEAVTVAPGDLSAPAVQVGANLANVFAPISPGVRQLVLTYQLAAGSFPISIPVERPVAVLEVLVEEPRADVAGAGLAESAAVSIEGRVFRRFLARDVPESGEIRVDAPSPAAQHQSATQVLVVVLTLLMAAAMAAWYAQRRGRAPVPVGAALSSSALLIGELAAMDARFERGGGVSRADYDRERAALKARIARALAEESGRV